MSKKTENTVELQEKEERIWNYAKLALFILSVPPLIHWDYQENINLFYKNIIEYAGIKEDLGIIKNTDSRNSKNNPNSVGTGLSDLSGFALTLASLAVAIYQYPELCVVIKMRNKDLWVLTHIIHIIGYGIVK